MGRSPGERNGNALQYSGLENPIDRGAWWFIVYGFTESDTTEQLTVAELAECGSDLYNQIQQCLESETVSSRWERCDPLTWWESVVAVKGSRELALEAEPPCWEWRSLK